MPEAGGPFCVLSYQKAAVLVFGMAFALLTFFMADVQPIWSVIDCAGRVGVLFMTRTLTDLRTP